MIRCPNCKNPADLLPTSLMMIPRIQVHEVKCYFCNARCRQPVWNGMLCLALAISLVFILGTVLDWIGFSVGGQVTLVVIFFYPALLLILAVFGKLYEIK